MYTYYSYYTYYTYYSYYSYYPHYTYYYMGSHFCAWRHDMALVSQDISWGHTSTTHPRRSLLVCRQVRYPNPLGFR